MLIHLISNIIKRMSKLNSYQVQHKTDYWKTRDTNRDVISRCHEFRTSQDPNNIITDLRLIIPLKSDLIIKLRLGVVDDDQLMITRIFLNKLFENVYKKMINRRISLLVDGTLTKIEDVCASSPINDIEFGDDNVQLGCTEYNNRSLDLNCSIIDLRLNNKKFSLSHNVGIGYLDFEITCSNVDENVAMTYKSGVFVLPFFEKSRLALGQIKRINNDIIYEFYIWIDKANIKPLVLIYQIEQNIFTFVQLNQRTITHPIYPSLEDAINILRKNSKQILCVGYSTKRDSYLGNDCILETYDLKSSEFLSRITLPGTFNIIQDRRIVSMTNINNCWIIYFAVPERERKEMQIILIDPFNGLVEILRKICMLSISNASHTDRLEVIDRINGNIEFIIKKNEYSHSDVPTVTYCY